jgi:DNA repair ATPase RecN
MSDQIDGELLGLINKLNNIQKEVGGGKAQTTNFDSEGRIDRFLDLRGMMTERLNKIKDTLETVRSLEKVPGSNPKELISAQSQVRTEMTALNDEWKELDGLYRNEAKKKRSKFTPEEMSARKAMLTTLQRGNFIVFSSNYHYFYFNCL